MNTRTPTLPRISLCFAVISALVGANAAMAQTAGSDLKTNERPIVKVVTPDGRITYTDRSVDQGKGARVQALRGGVGNRVLATSPAAAGTTSVGASAPAKPASGAASDLVAWAKQQEDRMKAQNEQVDSARAAINEASCGNAKQNLAMLERGRGRAGAVGPKGEIALYTDEQIQQKKDEAKSQIAEFCK